MALFTDDSVLVRTDEGESAARQPRRVASNRARAALLLLDGQLSVGEMKRRFGESLEVDDALMELLRDGLAVDRDDAVTDREEELPVMDEVVALDEPPTEMPPDPELSLPPGFVVASRPKPAAAQLAETRVEPRGVPGPSISSGEGSGEPEVDLDESISAAYGGEAPAAKKAALSEGPSSLAMLADRLRYHLTHAIRGATALVIAALIGVVMVVAWKSPEWSRAGILESARAVAGVEVSIEHLGPAWNKGPALRLSGVVVGRGEGAVPIASIVVAPDWFAFGSQGKLALGARLSGVDGRPTQLAEALNRADFARMGALRLVFEELKLRLSGRLSLILSGEGEVSEGALQKLVLSGADGLEFRVPMPLSFPLEFSASGREWRAPFLPSVALESLQFEGLLSDQGLQVVSLGGALHGGRYGGSVEIGWSDAITLHGDIQLEGLRLERLMPALRPAGDLEGALSGQLGLAAEAGSFPALAAAMKINSRIEIQRGRFGGLDVGAIMRERGTGVVRGGATRFDSMNLEVTMSMADRNLRAAIKRLDAGNLHVGGGLLIKADDVLSGNLTSTLSTGERSVSLPVVVSGTLGSPALRLAPEAVQ